MKRTRIKHSCLLFLSIIFVLSQNLKANDFDDRISYLSQLGKVLRCTKTQAANLQLIDLYEAKTQYFFQIDIPKRKTALEGALAIVDKLKDIHPTRHEYYTAIITHIFPAKTRFLKDIQLGGMPTDSAIIPKDCVQETVINLRVIPVDEDPGFDLEILIDQALFQELDYENRVASIIHVLLAMEGFANEMIETPVGTRMYTGLLLSKNIRMMDTKQFKDFLYQIDFYSWLDTFLPPPI